MLPILCPILHRRAHSVGQNALICRALRADAGTRTPDPFTTSEVLYQLSYVGNMALQLRFLVRLVIASPGCHSTTETACIAGRLRFQHGQPPGCERRVSGRRLLLPRRLRLQRAHTLTADNGRSEALPSRPRLRRRPTSSGAPLARYSQLRPIHDNWSLRPGLAGPASVRASTRRVLPPAVLRHDRDTPGSARSCRRENRRCPRMAYRPVRRCPSRVL